MAKYFSKQKIGWHRDPRCKALETPIAKWLNVVIWNIAVELKSETLPTYINAPTLGLEAGMDARSVRKLLTFMSTQKPPLITLNHDGSITVHGVRKTHETDKFQWNDTKQPKPKDVDVDTDACTDVLTDAEKFGDRQEKTRKDKIPEGEKEEKKELENQESLKYTVGDLNEICELATTRFNSRQVPAEIEPYVHNLLAQLDKSVIIKAINNVCDQFDQDGRERNMRGHFQNKFKSAKIVMQMAKQAVGGSVDGLTAIEKDIQQSNLMAYRPGPGEEGYEDYLKAKKTNEKRGKNE